MSAYLNWLQFLATFPPADAAKFRETGTEVSTVGDRLIWNCTDEALKSELIEPVLQQSPQILLHGFKEFEVNVDGERAILFEHQHLKGMLRDQNK